MLVVGRGQTQATDSAPANLRRGKGRYSLSVLPTSNSNGSRGVPRATPLPFILRSL